MNRKLLRDSSQPFMEKAFQPPKWYRVAEAMAHWGAELLTPCVSILPWLLHHQGMPTAPEETHAGPEPTRFRCGLANISSEPPLAGASRELMDFRRKIKLTHKEYHQIGPLSSVCQRPDSHWSLSCLQSHQPFHHPTLPRDGGTQCNT